MLQSGRALCLKKNLPGSKRKMHAYDVFVENKTNAFNSLLTKVNKMSILTDLSIFIFH